MKRRGRKAPPMAKLISRSDADFGALAQCPRAVGRRRHFEGRVAYVPAVTKNPGRAAVEKQRKLNGWDLFFQRVSLGTSSSRAPAEAPSGTSPLETPGAVSRRHDAR